MLEETEREVRVLSEPIYSTIDWIPNLKISAQKYIYMCFVPENKLVKSILYDLILEYRDARS